MDIKTGLPTNARQTTAEALKQVLGETFAVYVKTHGFHWNVRGPQFRSLHILFEEQYNELWAALDVIAERVRALGVLAPQSIGALAALANTKDAGEDVGSEAMLKELIAGHASLIKVMRSALDTAEGVKDDVTVDLLTQRLNASEKHTWMLRSTLGEV